MSGIIGISVITALCIFSFAFGAAVLYTALRDNEYIFAIIGGIIFVVSSIGFYYLDEPFTDVQNKIAENGTEYKAVHQNEIKSFADCYKENGFNVCETKDGKEMVVEHYWKKDESKKKKEKKKNNLLKYKGVKNSEIKKYTSCEDDGDNKICIDEDGTKETVETYWHFTNKEK